MFHVKHFTVDGMHGARSDLAFAGYELVRIALGDMRDVSEMGAGLLRPQAEDGIAEAREMPENVSVRVKHKCSRAAHMLPKGL